MPSRRRTYSIDERHDIVAEVLRRYAAGEGSYRAISEKLGVRENEFQYWRRSYAPLPAPLRAEPVSATPAGVKATKPPYSPIERERLRCEVDRLRAAGYSAVAACAQAGIAPDSYRKWSAAASPSPAMRPVEVACESTALVPVGPQALAIAPSQALTLAPPRPAASQGLVLVAPGGYRVEGLAVESAAALLRALA